MSAGDIFRWCRWLHGYLSAFAFLSLMLFSVSGLVLNHPEWLRAGRTREHSTQITLSAEALAAAQRTADPGRALAKAVEAAAPIVGGFKDSQIEGGEALLRWDGAKGFSDAAVDLTTGKAGVKMLPASTLGLLNELHRGRRAGTAWKAFIDISAVLFLVLSVIGYVLFFSMRFRLRSSLVVTGVSLALMVGLIWFLTT